MVKKILKSEEHTFIFTFYPDLAEGVIDRSGTLNLKNRFELLKGKSSLGKIPEPHFLISNKLCGGLCPTFEGLVFLINVLLFNAVGVLQLFVYRKLMAGVPKSIRFCLI